MKKKYIKPFCEQVVIPDLMDTAVPITPGSENGEANSKRNNWQSEENDDNNAWDDIEVSPWKAWDDKE